MSAATPTRDRYLVKSVVHASRLLTAFRSSGEALPLREVAARSALPKSMAFRLLYTLERCGMVEKVGENLYRSYVRPFKQKLFRLGYAAQGTDYQFSKEISTGLQRAATVGAAAAQLSAMGAVPMGRALGGRANTFTLHRIAGVLPVGQPAEVAADVAVAVGCERVEGGYRVLAVLAG